MSIIKLSNIPLKTIRKYLVSKNLKQINHTKGRGGHEKWIGTILDRPITLQSHICPVPEHIVKQILRHLNVDRKTFGKELNEL